MKDRNDRAHVPTDPRYASPILAPNHFGVCLHLYTAVYPRGSILDGRRSAPIGRICWGCGRFEDSTGAVREPWGVLDVWDFAP